MSTAARHGGRGGRRCRSLELQITRLLLVALAFALLAAPRARAEGMYRCVGSSGETVFTSSTAGYHHCRALHLPPVRTAPAPAPSSRSAVAPAAAATTAAKPLHAKHPAWKYRQGTAERAPRLPASGVARGAHVLRGAVYRVEHADGSVEYTNVRPRGSKARGTSMKTLFTYIATCVACDVHSNIDWAHVPLRTHAFRAAIRAAATRYRVDPALLRAVIHAESAFNPHAVSAKGAQGLMQLMPDTASDMGVQDAFDARQNIRGGARYLAQLLQAFNGDDRLAAAAYNAGPDAVQKYGGVPPYPETRVYVQRVTLLHRRYRKALESMPSLTPGSPGKAN